MLDLTGKICKDKKITMLAGVSIATGFPVSDLVSCIKITHFGSRIQFPGTYLTIVQKMFIIVLFIHPKIRGNLNYPIIRVFI